MTCANSTSLNGAQL